MINFTKFTLGYFIFSLIVIGVGLFSLFNGGLKLGIDFTGGSIVSYSRESEFKKADVEKALKKQEIKLVSYTQDSPNDITMRTVAIDEKKEAALRKELKATSLKFDSVGPSLGKETMRKTAIASIVAILGILLYISFTFKKFNYGIAAIVALLHDILVLTGVYSILTHFGAEFDALFVTALLTAMSFSVHDTIVVFDKIREYRRTSALPIEDLANRALTETMVRSLNNSLTIMLMLVPLTLMGGDSLHYFAAALLIGTITGTYSSPFIATPLLVLLEKRKK
ncbi:protein translocase subunit SecF [Candidatus Woesebacteria bacterium]|nr:protein translocase subunit SecF [Candidatus Woesebacteria bacterium]